MAETPPPIVGQWARIPHYYGQIIRQLLVAVAALMLVGAPFYADAPKVEWPFEIVGAIVLVGLAALTNPHSRNVMYGNAIASGVGLLIYQTWALYGYDPSLLLQFFLRQLLAILFLGAFYFSMKTLRAMLLGKIGKEWETGEFDDNPPTASADAVHDEEENIVHFHVEDEGKKEPPEPHKHHSIISED